MAKGIERAIAEGRPIEYRTLGYIPEVTAKEVALEEPRREVDRECKADPRFAPLSLEFPPMAKAA